MRGLRVPVLQVGVGTRLRLPLLLQLSQRRVRVLIQTRGFDIVVRIYTCVWTQSPIDGVWKSPETLTKSLYMRHCIYLGGTRVYIWTYTYPPSKPLLISKPQQCAKPLTLFALVLPNLNLKP